MNVENNPNYVINDDNIALIHTVGSINELSKFNSSKVNFNLKDKQGRSAVDLAKTLDIATELIKFGVHKNNRDVKGIRSLTYLRLKRVAARNAIVAS